MIISRATEKNVTVNDLEGREENEGEECLVAHSCKINESLSTKYGYMDQKAIKSPKPRKCLHAF